jgi:tRNA threonylcarbamoyl adenosine modification protein YeaZ
LILAIDTSGEEMVVARLGPGGSPSGVVADSDRRHQAVIVGAIERVVTPAGGLAQVEAIAVVVGPGSYTGLRVGLATASGLAYSRRLPIYPLTSLTVAASRAAPGTARVTALVGAGRGNVYAQAFAEAGPGMVPAGARWSGALDELDLGPDAPVIAEPALLTRCRELAIGPVAAAVGGEIALQRATEAVFRSGHPLDYDQLRGDYGP